MLILLDQENPNIVPILGYYCTHRYWYIIKKREVNVGFFKAEENPFSLLAVIIKQKTTYRSKYRRSKNQNIQQTFKTISLKRKNPQLDVYTYIYIYIRKYKYTKRQTEISILNLVYP